MTTGTGLEDFVADFKLAAPELMSRTADKIQREIPSLNDERSRRTLMRTIKQATAYFISLLASEFRSGSSVHSRFQHIGRAEAVTSPNLDAVSTAHLIALEEYWKEVDRLVEVHQLQGQALYSCVETMFNCARTLRLHTLIGFEHTRRHLKLELADAQDRLITALMTKAPRHEIQELASEAGWEFPDKVIVITTEHAKFVRKIELPQPSPTILRRVLDHHVLLITEDHPDTSLAHLVENVPHDRLAFQRLNEPSLVGDACRWTKNALELADKGLIEQSPVIDCSHEQEALWFYSDLALARTLCDQMMSSLGDLSPGERESLLIIGGLWIRDRPPSEALAKKLGITTTVVNERLGRFTDFFRQLIDRPETALPVWLAISAVLNKPPYLN